MFLKVKITIKVPFYRKLKSGGVLLRIKFNTKPNENDFNNNSIKVVGKFLFLPKVLNKELRWLEKTEYIQFVDCKAHYYEGGSIGYSYNWKDLCWCDDIPNEYYNDGRFLSNVKYIK